MSVIIDSFYPSISLQKECTSKSLFKSIVGPWQTVQSKFLSTSVYPPKHREVSQGSDQDVSVQINPATRPLGAIVREKNSPYRVYTIPPDGWFSVKWTGQIHERFHVDITQMHDNNVTESLTEFMFKSIDIRPTCLQCGCWEKSQLIRQSFELEMTKV